MPLKVIGAGVGRTGTLSLKVALEELGFTKCYHMQEVFPRPAHIRAWDDAAQGKAVDWETILRGFQATVDYPACCFYQDFLRLYPEAKVILTVRDPERWYESTRQTIYAVRRAVPGWLLPYIPRLGRFLRMADRLIWDGMFQGRFEDKAFALETFNRHNEEVRRFVPSEKLLVYEVKDGWPPLCAFLGVPVPHGKPFPHLNVTAEFRSMIRRIVWTNRIFAVGVIGLIALAVTLLAIWMRG